MTVSKAAVFVQAGLPLQIQLIPIPTLQTSQILVRNEFTTLCRSDLTTFSGKRTELTPTILGHEVVGRIVGLGPSATPVDLRGETLKIGDRITWAIFASDPAAAMSHGVCLRSPLSDSSTATSN